MIDKIISFCLSQRLFVSLIALIILALGVRSYEMIPVDAFPDISPTQVKIIMKSDGMTPEEVETGLTIVIERAMVGIPNQTILRSTTKYGLCDISIDFKEGTDIYWARQQVTERLNGVMDELPANIQGGLAPISTPLSEILMFTIESDTLSLEEKRSLLDWFISPKIRSISGVAEVNALGGLVKTFEVVPNLSKMQTLHITLDALSTALKENNSNSGIGRVSQGVESILVRSVGRMKDIEDIRKRPLKKINGNIITVGDVAKVQIGHLTRAGFVTTNGNSEAVEGLVLGLKGSNTEHVLIEVKKAMEQMTPMLPTGTKLNIFYDRSKLVNIATSTVKKALMEAVVLIIVVLLLMLGNVASAFSVALILPFALLMSFIAMRYFGLSSNLMSLGGLAIAIGMLVDSAVVVVEHITAELGNEKHKNDSKLNIIYNAVKEISTPITTGVLVIIIVFMPLLTLEGLEGKLFTPVALSIVFALFSSLILALTVIPVLSSFILKKRPDKESFLIAYLLKYYHPILLFSIKHSKSLIVSVILMFGGSIFLASKTGSIFMPTLDEGSILVMIETNPTISLDESIALNYKIQTKLLKKVPEIKSIIARTGTDELGLDPMSLNDTDTFMVLQDVHKWRVQDKEWLKQKIRDVLDTFVGIEYAFTQPIEMRVSEMLTGARGDVAVDIFGSENDKIDKIATDIKNILENLQGSKDVYKKINEGVSYFEISFNQNALGLYGVNEDDISLFMKTMINGVKVGTINEGLKRISLMIKGEELMQTSLNKLKHIYYVLPNGKSIPLSNLVSFKQNVGPVQITHENGYRKSVVQSNVEGRDLVGYVEEIKKAIEEKVKLPAGYYINYGGEFKNQQRAASRLMLIIPVALFMIFILLFLSFKSIKQAVLVLVNVPLALIGGFAGLYFSGEYISVPASVGFIALLGIAVLNGIVMVNYFNYLIDSGYKVYDSVIQGSMKRFRPVLMTATIAAFGLIPLLFATGPGSEIQKPLAIVVINGLLSSTILTLVILPVLYLMFTKDAKLLDKKTVQVD